MNPDCGSTTTAFPVDSKGLWRTLDIPGLERPINGRGGGYTDPGWPDDSRRSSLTPWTKPAP